MLQRCDEGYQYYCLNDGSGFSLSRDYKSLLAPALFVLLTLHTFYTILQLCDHPSKDGVTALYGYLFLLYTIMER